MNQELVEVMPRWAMVLCLVNALTACGAPADDAATQPANANAPSVSGPGAGEQGAGGPATAAPGATGPEVPPAPGAIPGQPTTSAGQPVPVGTCAIGQAIAPTSGAPSVPPGATTGVEGVPAGTSPVASNVEVPPGTDVPVDGMPPAAADATPPPEGAPGAAGALQIGNLCVPICVGAGVDDDADGCGYEGGTDCVMPDAEIALNAVSCEYSAAAPAAGDGFQIGCDCQRACETADSDVDDEGVSDGYGWEYGESCVVADSEATTGKVACEPLPRPSGPGYLVKNEDGVAHCVPPCEAPELADNVDGWGWEHQFQCVVEGSSAEAQVARCENIETPYPFAPGDGFYVLGEEGAAGECHPPCSASADDGDEADDGWGFEMDRSCVFADSTVAKIDAVPCIPPPSEVSGVCPADLACPTAAGKTLECGCTWVDGFAERKAEIVLAIGAEGSQSWGRFFLASAMMETNTLLADYPDGDVYPDGRPKTGDAYNSGLTKQNWGMMRTCWAPWRGLAAGDYQTSAVMRTDLQLDVQVYNACRTAYAADDWFAAHRIGDRSNRSDDVLSFKAAQEWTHAMLQEGEGHYADDVYFWVDVTAI